MLALIKCLLLFCFRMSIYLYFLDNPSDLFPSSSRTFWKWRSIEAEWAEWFHSQQMVQACHNLLVVHNFVRVTCSFYLISLPSGSLEMRKIIVTWIFIKFNFTTAAQILKLQSTIIRIHTGAVRPGETVDHEGGSKLAPFALSPAAFWFITVCQNLC